MPRFLHAVVAAFAITAGQSASHSAVASEARVIVAFKDDSTGMARAASVDRLGPLEQLAERSGLKLRRGSLISDSIEVVHADGLNSVELARRLSRDARVRFAVPDRLRRVQTQSNDSLRTNQWYLDDIERSAARVSDAWGRTTGSGVVVAVVDTGVIFDHPDLSAKLLPGYDFISDAPNAGDGDGRDSDASDAGDYVTEAEAADAALKAVCGDSLEPGDSSWHGTRVAGLVAAQTNNAIGIAGVSWGARILPVRVLGKCGGYDSDIIAGMRWAAGLRVGGAPINPYPARVINLSLGGEDTCGTAYQSAVEELLARNVLVVAAAGNETGPVDTPGNCLGVLAVAGVRHTGTKVGYSSFGPEVGIAAPAGNCVNTGQGEPCLYSIHTTTNLGQTAPGDHGYTDQYNYNVGTSFATPLVSGVAALMLSLNAGLTPQQIIQRLKQTARVFPFDPALPTCPQVGVEGQTGQCNCTTTTCGGGLLDAASAVAGVLDLNGVIGTPANGSTVSGVGVISGYHCSGQAIEVQIDGVSVGRAGAGTTLLGTAAVCGRTNTGYSLLYNFGNLTEGKHTVSVFADGVLFGESVFNSVRSGGIPWLAGMEKSVTIDDFPTAGQSVTAAWSQSYQNFLVTAVSPGYTGHPPMPSRLEPTVSMGVLGTPVDGAVVSGVGVISGYHCNARSIEVRIDGVAVGLAGSGTTLLGTAGVCGRTDTGFSLLFNFNNLTEGIHTVDAYADGALFDSNVIDVVRSGGTQWLSGVARAYSVEDFPQAGRKAILEWSQSYQNFMVTGLR